MTGRLQRVAAYNVCVDANDRLLLCRLSNITERPGSWTLPGGGVEFGEHPEAAALRELAEETGLQGEILELLAVDSVARDRYHAIRIVYRTNVEAGTLKHEAAGSTDLAAWCTRADLAGMPLVDTAHLGMRLAFHTP